MLENSLLTADGKPLPCAIDTTPSDVSSRSNIFPYIVSYTIRHFNAATRELNVAGMMKDPQYSSIFAPEGGDFIVYSVIHIARLFGHEIYKLDLSSNNIHKISQLNKLVLLTKTFPNCKHLALERNCIGLFSYTLLILK